MCKTSSEKWREGTPGRRLRAQGLTQGGVPGFSLSLMHPRLGDKEGGSPGPTGTDRTSPDRSLLFLAKGPGKGYPAIRLSESTLLL